MSSGSESSLQDGIGSGRTNGNDHQVLAVADERSSTSEGSWSSWRGDLGGIGGGAWRDAG